MIPLRLELKNFMSYGEDVSALDFSGMHMLCLSGENGNGKSALLDAMTWALWGESRLGRQGHEELIRKGADEMSVIFTFEMDGQVYRILRKRSKRSGGQQWELHQRTPDQGLGIGWRPLTGTSSSDTGAAIQKLLRMSYDTFLNSAYLRQGQADQFVRQSASKRKEILADILDLSRYDQLEAKARHKASEARAEATDLERDVHVIDAELSGEDAHKEALTRLQERRGELHDEQEALRAEWDALKDRKGQLDGQKQFTDSLTAQKAALEKELAELGHESREQQGELDQLRGLLARHDEICRDYEALLAARKSSEELEDSVARWHKGQKLLGDAEREWLTAENEVRAKADRSARDHEQATARVQDYPKFKQNYESLTPRVAAAEAAEGERQAVAQKREAVERQFHVLREESAGLDVQIRHWQERVDALNQQRGVCDICDSPLPPDRVAAVRDGYETQLAQAQAGRKRVRAEAASLKDEITALQKRESQLDAQIKAGREDHVRLAQLNQQLFQLEEIQKDIPNLAALREATARALQERAFAPEVRARIENYKAHLARLDGVETQYAAAKARLSALADAERRHLELQHAQKTLREVEARFARTQKVQAQRLESLKAVEIQMAAVPDVGKELAQIEARTEQVVTQGKARRQEENVVIQETRTHEDALKRLSGLRQTRVEKAKRLFIAQREHEVHEQLTKAFGKKGVQALIIENAIPELQEEANRLLERLTDGDMRLFFETLKDSKAKKDSPIETLEIKVEDSSGPRPLEMYSGGESFRAAFALRIALSKLLARRAGARLQTLIIDEGFGTQDGKGREKLVDALTAISDDFERIIVISHIDELKDAFPTRVEITKTPSGSQITVMEGAAG